VGYWTGPLNDRLGRRTLMLTADFARAGLSLCFLLIDRPERVPLIYVITVLMVLFRAIFEPARKAALPDVVSRENMVAANAISGATWSSMLALGAAVGGLVAGIFGAKIAFTLNSLSFLLSAFFVSRLRFSSDELEKPKRAPWGECFRYLKSRPRILVYSMSKTLWCIGGGLTLVLTLYGSDIFPMGKGGATTIGLFYAFRGLGSVCGPFLAYRLKGHAETELPRMLIPAFFMGALGYFLLSQAWSLPLALGCVLLAHLGGSTQWVFSTSLLQLSLDPEVRGRVFALEYTGLNLAMACSSYLVGRASDQGFSPPELAQILGLVFCCTGSLMAVALFLTRERQESRE
jgi:MFS family permease